MQAVKSSYASALWWAAAVIFALIVLIIWTASRDLGEVVTSGVETDANLVVLGTLIAERDYGSGNLRLLELTGNGGTDSSTRDLENLQIETIEWVFDESRVNDARRRFVTRFIEIYNKRMLQLVGK